MKEALNLVLLCLCRHLSIFPGRRQPSIFDANELNFRVRNGNGWNLLAIDTGCFKKQNRKSYKMSQRTKTNQKRKSNRPISTCKLNMSPCLHFKPINLVVYKGSYSEEGISYLKGGFTLRCFQRLSGPHVAAQLCHWRDNWCTRGASIPVLSY